MLKLDFLYENPDDLRCKNLERNRDPFAAQILAMGLLLDLDSGFEWIVSNCWHDLYSLAYSLMENHHDAEEMVQETFIRAYKALRGYSEERRASLHVRAWLYTILRNTVRSYHIRESRLVSLDSEENSWLIEKESSRFEQPEAIVLREETRQQLSHLVQSLPYPYDTVIELRFFGGRTNEEIAEMLCYTSNAVRCYVHRAIRRLSLALEKLDEYEGILDIRDLAAWVDEAGIAILPLGQ